jgi:hypothetical protein
MQNQSRKPQRPEKKSQLDFARSKDSIPSRIEEVGTLWLVALSVFFFVIWILLLFAYVQNTISFPKQYVVFLIISLAMSLVIQAAIIRWACRADRVIEHCRLLESYLSLLLAYIHRNKCDMCGKIKHPSQLELLDTGKIICRPCKDNLFFNSQEAIP